MADESVSATTVIDAPAAVPLSDQCRPSEARRDRRHWLGP